jgi:hypothetical protein
MLISQLERAESVVKDLFLEATDDGIEALEAVLAACREEVLKRGPRVHEAGGDGGGAPDGGEPEGGEAPEGGGGGGNRGGGAGRNRRGRNPRGRRGGPRFDQAPNPHPIADEPPRPASGDEPYNEAAS